MWVESVEKSQLYVVIAPCGFEPDGTIECHEIPWVFFSGFNNKA